MLRFLFEQLNYEVDVDTLLEVIKKTLNKNEWCVFSEAGKRMGCYSTKAEAEKRLDQIEMFKHMNEALGEATKKWTKDSAMSWLKEHDFKTSDFEKMENYFSFRQTDPKQYDSFKADKAPFNFNEAGGCLVIFGIKGAGDNKTSEIQTIRFYHGGKIKEESESFYKYIVNKMGVAEQIDIEGGVEKVLRALLVDQYGLDKTNASKIVKAGFNKQAVMEVMDSMGLAEKLKSDYMKLIAQWKQDINYASHSDLEFLMKESECPFVLLEAQEGDGSVWKVAVIEKGKSYNSTVYTDNSLDDIVRIINEADKGGAPIKCNAFKLESMLNHLPETARKFVKGFVENIVGWFKNAKKIGNQVIAELHLDEGAEKIKSLLKTAYKKNIKMPFGLSIDGDGDVEEGFDGSSNVINVLGVKTLNSIDCVTYPSAGGKFLSLIESIFREEQKMYRLLLEMIARIYGDLVEGIEVEKADLEVAKKILAEASKKDARFKIELTEENVSDVIKKVTDIEYAIREEAKTAKIAPVKVEPKTNDDMKKIVEAELKALKEALTQERCEMLLKKLLDESALPSQFKEQLTEDFKGRIFEEDELKKKIDSMEKAVSQFKEVSAGGQTRVKVITDVRDKQLDSIQASMDILCDVRDDDGKLVEGVDRWHGSIKRAYIDITGDEYIDGMVDMNSRNSRLHESIKTSDFTKVLANSQTKRMVREYNIGDALYRKIASVVPIDNFKTQDRVAFGEFSNLATVAEDAAYVEFTNPSEERAQYAAITKGNNIGISRRAILNDDLKAFGKLVKHISRAALRTVNQFAFDKMLNYVTAAINDGTIYDTTALYTVAHNNITSDALTFTSLDAALVKMYNHKDMDAKQELGITPKYLVIPRDLLSTAKRILNSELIPGTTYKTFNDVNPVYKSVEILVSPFLRSDANNWYLVADPMIWDGLEIGFVLGRETPTLITANQESASLMFTNDRIVYKVRHEYGGVIEDYRPFYMGTPT